VKSSIKGGKKQSKYKTPKKMAKSLNLSDPGRAMENSDKKIAVDSVSTTQSTSTSNAESLTAL